VDIEFILKLVTATVAVVGVLIGFLHFLTTRRSVGHQNLKTELELLSQSIAAYEAEPHYLKFLTDVRKEKISLLVFGISIPNAMLDHVIMYHKDAEGKVTAGDIALAWEYRNRRAKQLSFRLRGTLKIQFCLFLLFAVVCLLTAGGGLVALIFKVSAKEAVALICVSLVACLNTLWINQGLFMAARLGALEKKT
jgi:hypothetical protein